MLHIFTLYTKFRTFWKKLTLIITTAKNQPPTKHLNTKRAKPWNCFRKISAAEIKSCFFPNQKKAPQWGDFCCQFFTSSNLILLKDFETWQVHSETRHLEKIWFDLVICSSKRTPKSPWLISKRADWRFKKIYQTTTFLVNKTVTGWWLNQPIWKILVKLEIFPK